MRKLSIKSRVTIWYTVFVSILTALFIFILIASVTKTTESMSKMRLMNAVEWATAATKYDKAGNLKINPDINKIKGVDIVIYKLDNTPVYRGKTSVILDEPFEEKTIRSIDSGSSNYFISDHLITFKHHESLWVRGTVAVDPEQIASASLVKLSIAIFPFAVIIMAIGGYIITKRAFNPVSEITALANNISGGSDLSKRVKIHNDNHVNDEITELAEIFDKMFQRLQNSFESERRFTSDVSHELRTPTSVIISQCEYLLSTETDDDKKESLTAILNQSQKMTALISQLLMLARTDSNKQSFNFEDINLSETIQIVIEELAFGENGKNIQIIPNIEPDIFIWADQALIMRMLINLITNGLNYGREDGFVKVSLSLKDDIAYGEISDNGIGIAEENLPKLWARFFQVNPARNNPEGSSGLGLSMVKWIVEKHGGQISVSSILGEGTTFSLSLSRAYKKQ